MHTYIEDLANIGIGSTAMVAHSRIDPFLVVKIDAKDELSDLNHKFAANL
jgi:hypothetical protein